MEYGDLSIIVSTALDSMGYSFESVKQRQLFDLSRLTDMMSFENVLGILTGSTGEGISQLFSQNNDIDIMYVSTDMRVHENISNADSFKEDESVLIMERINVAPGYTKIRCINKKSSIKPDYFRISNRAILNIVEIDGCCYLGHSWEGDEELKRLKHSQIHETELDEDGDEVTFEMQLSGPAINTNYESIHSKFNFKCDLVYAIPCFCSSHIQKWATRTRYYGWPDKQLISKLKYQIGYVVPVGFKESTNFDLEWRICYTEIEMSLVRSLNETQIKMFVLLKMVAKAILKPICKDITSYIIKNLVLWIAERNSNAIFTPDNLMSLVMLGLRSLRNKVSLRLFGSYMIPERNLFAGKITEHEKVETVRILDDILTQGPNFLMRFTELDKLKNAIDDAICRPLLTEIKTRTWHFCSLMFYDILFDNEKSDDDKRDDKFKDIYKKGVLGSFLAVNFSEIDDISNEFLTAVLFDPENTLNESENKTIGEIYEKTLKDESDLFSTVFDFLALQ